MFVIASVCCSLGCGGVPGPEVGFIIAVRLMSACCTQVSIRSEYAKTPGLYLWNSGSHGPEFGDVYNDTSR